jgi:methylphosphotriester-DNA--protein-cysteine methyltransferase
MDRESKSPVIADAVQTVERAIERTNLRRLSEEAGVNYNTLRTLHKRGLVRARQVQTLDRLHAAALEILSGEAA